MSVGFIGLGRMGSGMVGSLLADGLDVKVFDRRPEAIGPLVDKGARPVSKAREVAEGAHIVITMLPGPEEVEAVLLGEEGLADRLEDDAIWVDMSSSSLDSLERVLAASPHRGWTVLDAPVTGGVPAAEAGTLQVFVGGQAEDFLRAKAVLDVVGTPEKVVHVGGQGAGYAVKLCLNLGFFMHAIAGAEVMSLGLRAGLDPDVLHRALTGSGATSSFLENDLLHNVFEGDYKEYFRLSLALKDLRLAVDLGRRVGVPLEIAALVEQIHRRALQRYGDGGQLLGVRDIEDSAGVLLRRTDAVRFEAKQNSQEEA